MPKNPLDEVLLLALTVGLLTACGLEDRQTPTIAAAGSSLRGESPGSEYPFNPFDRQWKPKPILMDELPRVVRLSSANP